MSSPLDWEAEALEAYEEAMQDKMQQSTPAAEPSGSSRRTATVMAATMPLAQTSRCPPPRNDMDHFQSRAGFERERRQQQQWSREAHIKERQIPCMTEADLTPQDRQLVAQLRDGFVMPKQRDALCRHGKVFQISAPIGSDLTGLVGVSGHSA